MKKLSKLKYTAVTCLGVLLASTVLPSSARSAPVSAAYYPHEGDNQYKVRRYNLDIKYTPDSKNIDGTALLYSTMLKTTDKISLDMELDVTSLQVNGSTVSYNKTAGKVNADLTNPIQAGERFTVRVEYSGLAREHEQSGEFDGGWIHTGGESLIIGEPSASKYWYPANDSLRSKATYKIHITAPQSKEAISNGTLDKVQTNNDGTKTWFYTHSSPMLSYLSFMAVGDYDIIKGKDKYGRNYLYAISDRLTGDEYDAAYTSLKYTSKFVQLMSKKLGPYPFDSMGGVAAGVDIPWALETQTRPVYPISWYGGPWRWLVGHEMAHMWFGDSVSLARWRDIYLNEGLASWAEQYAYAEVGKGRTANSWFINNWRRNIKNPSGAWSVPLTNPGLDYLFDSDVVYWRGMMATQALRYRVGKPMFWKVLRVWVKKYKNSNATVADFKRVAENVSGKNLDAWYKSWLSGTTRPAVTLKNGFPKKMVYNR